MTCSTCPYCGVGCGVVVSEDPTLSLVGDTNHPANQGKLCIKGTHLIDTLEVQDHRLLYPSIRGERISWGAAIEAVAGGFQRTIDHFGSDSVAFYLSGQLLTEDYYVANKLMKGFIGSANVDTNSRLCMSSAVAAHKRAFGEDVVPCDYSDLDQCDLIVLVGSNTAWAHPVLYQRIAQRKADGDLTVVVIDPRETETTAIADLHLPLMSGSDVSLFNGLLSFLSQNGAIDRDFIANATTGFDDAIQAAEEDAKRVSLETGLSAQEIESFYRLFLKRPNVITFYSQGVNQSTQGTDKANAIINCHLATGRIGKPGAGPFSITGQPNAMGGREVGGMANQLAAHMDFDEASIDRVGRFWNAANMARGPGLKAVDMFDAVADGQIKAIWIMGTNPAISLPNAKKVRAALERCPFVVVSDCVEKTDTAKFADVLLPALGWGEKDGTVTNSERCVSRQRGFLDAPGLARADWRIMCDVALQMGYGEAFQYSGVHEVFAEHVALTDFENDGRRLLNLRHMNVQSRDDYDALTPTQWPVEARPFSAGRFSTPTGRANIVPVQQNVVPALKADELVFNTGRLRDQWHTMTRTGYARKLFNQTRWAQLDVHPKDAQARQIEACDLVEVSNALGALRYVANVTESQNEGAVFAPIHWTHEFSNQACVSDLVEARLDPNSGQPESKLSAVSVKRREVQSWVALVSRHRLDTNDLDAQGFDYWSISPVGEHWASLIARTGSSDFSSLLPLTDIVSYQFGHSKRMLGRTMGRVEWLACVESEASELPTMEHLSAQLDADVADWRRLASSGLGEVDTSPMICSCFEVSEDQIVAAVDRGCCSIEALGVELKCGTNCGSCVPQLAQYLVHAKDIKVGLG